MRFGILLFISLLLSSILTAQTRTHSLTRYSDYFTANNTKALFLIKKSNWNSARFTVRDVYEASFTEYVTVTTKTDSKGNTFREITSTINGSRLPQYLAKKLCVAYQTKANNGTTEYYVDFDMDGIVDLTIYQFSDYSIFYTGGLDTYVWYKGTLAYMGDGKELKICKATSRTSLFDDIESESLKNKTARYAAIAIPDVKIDDGNWLYGYSSFEDKYTNVFTIPIHFEGIKKVAYYNANGNEEKLKVITAEYVDKKQQKHVYYENSNSSKPSGFLTKSYDGTVLSNYHVTYDSYGNYKGIVAPEPQKFSVKGKITDASDGSPMLGASVFIKNTTNGTVANLDGNYSFSELEKGSVVQVSFVGYVPQEKVVNNSGTLNFSLKPVKVEKPKPTVSKNKEIEFLNNTSRTLILRYVYYLSTGTEYKTKVNVYPGKTYSFKSYTGEGKRDLAYVNISYVSGGNEYFYYPKLEPNRNLPPYPLSGITKKDYSEGNYYYMYLPIDEKLSGAGGKYLLSTKGKSYLWRDDETMYGVREKGATYIKLINKDYSETKVLVLAKLSTSQYNEYKSQVFESRGNGWYIFASAISGNDEAYMKIASKTFYFLVWEGGFRYFKDQVDLSSEYRSFKDVRLTKIKVREDSSKPIPEISIYKD